MRLSRISLQKYTNIAKLKAEKAFKIGNIEMR